MAYACPNDGEELVKEVVAPATKNGAAVEAYVCSFCKYRSDENNAKSKLQATGAGYLPPSKVAAAPKIVTRK